jgi:hypothetical protein
MARAVDNDYRDLRHERCEAIYARAERIARADDRKHGNTNASQLRFRRCEFAILSRDRRKRTGIVRCKRLFADRVDLRLGRGRLAARPDVLDERTNPVTVFQRCRHAIPQTMIVIRPRPAGRDQHERSHALRMQRGELQRDPTAHRVAGDVRSADLQMFEQSPDVLDHR